MAAQNQGDLFDAYFRRADLDGDGKISGSEAVAFFQGANLSKQVLAQIWNYADQNRIGSLGRAEFYNALKLVTVAQSKRELTPDIVKAAIFSPASAKIPAPQINLAALSAPQASAAGAIPSASQMATRGSATSQNTGLRPTLSNTTVNQQYNPSQGSGLVRPLNSVSSVPVQGVGFQGFPVGAPQPGSNPPGSGVSRGLGVPNVANTSTATFAERGNIPLSNQAGLPSGAPVPVLSSKPPIASGVPSPSPMQPRPPVTQNGYASGSQLGMSSVGNMQVSSPSIPALAGSLSVGGQNPKMQSHLKMDAQTLAPRPSIRPNGPPSVQPQTSIGHQPQVQWPRATQSDIQKYTKVFMEVDTDKDGKITGEQARNLFLSWRLPREVLKQVWNLSDQDNDSMLSVREFCIALYLMERYREGRPLPAVLPNTVMLDFPANAQPVRSYDNTSRGYSAGFQQPQVTGAGQRPAARPPGKPPLPMPAASPDQGLPPKPQKAKVPVLEKHLVDQLSEEDQKSLNAKFQEASEANKKVEDLEKEIKEAKEKMEFYRVKMQELVLYKSRCDNRLNEVTERAVADKREVESLAKKYEEKYLQAGDVASKLTIEEATFRDIQERKMEMYQAIVKMEQDGSDETLQVRADRIQGNLEELVRSLSERCKKYGLRSKPTTLVELPFGWQPGIQEGAADWDEDWDKFEDEGFTFVKEMTLDVQNVVAPPKQKVKVVKKEKASTDEGEAVLHVSDTESKTVKAAQEDVIQAENGLIANQKEDNVLGSPVASPSGRTSHGTPSNGSKENHFETTVGSNTSPRSKQSPSDGSSIGDKRFDEPTQGTFDTSDDADSVWGSSKAKGRERHIDDLFGHGEFTLPPIRTSSAQTEEFLPKKSVFADSVPGTPADVFLPKKSLFDDSVPSTPAEGFLPKHSIFADSVPSTPLFSSSYSPHKDGEGQEERGYNFSRFDSFRSSDSGFQPQERFSRFDSMRSTRELDSEDGEPFQQTGAFSRFDSMKSTQDSDFGHRFSSFDDSDPFGSETFKSSFISETPRRDSDAFGSSAFQSSFGSETPRSEVDPFGSVGPFRSSFGSETPRADTDFYGSASGPFRSSFGSETPRADTDQFGSIGPFGSSMGNETPRRENDYFANSGSFNSSFGETPKGEYDSFGFGGPFSSSFSSETPRRDSDAYGSTGPFKSSFSETPKGGTDGWSAF
ncbi:uncharacterized protein LOC141648358 [Silene latifolia]|uniref:uncharacterized protein LOC141648358 n=1 Tax=Silene latifolia TaxID=37657 RepID=UPI003D77E354